MIRKIQAQTKTVFEMNFIISQISRETPFISIEDQSLFTFFIYIKELVSRGAIHNLPIRSITGRTITLGLAGI